MFAPKSTRFGRLAPTFRMSISRFSVSFLSGRIVSRSVDCPRIALIVSKIFGVVIDKDVVRRALAKHYLLSARRLAPSIWLMPSALTSSLIEKRPLP